MDIDIPINNRKYFTISSLWLLIPIIKSYDKDYILHINLILNFLFSILHWYYYKHNSLFHKLDKILSSNTILIIYCNNYNNIYIYIMLYLMYYTLKEGRIHMLNKVYNKHLVYHIMFRYLAFWTCCIYLEHINVELFLYYSVLYSGTTIKLLE